MQTQKISKRRIVLLLCLLCAGLFSPVHGQFYKKFGETGVDEGASSIIKVGSSLYVGGYNDDKASILELDLAGNKTGEWVLDIDVHRDDLIYDLMWDTDDLVFCGSSRNPSDPDDERLFIGKFNPSTSSIIWIRRGHNQGTTSTRLTDLNIRPGGNYVVTGMVKDQFVYGSDALTMVFNANTGAIIQQRKYYGSDPANPADDLHSDDLAAAILNSYTGELMVASRNIAPGTGGGATGTLQYSRIAGSRFDDMGNYAGADGYRFYVEPNTVEGRGYGMDIVEGDNGVSSYIIGIHAESVDTSEYKNVLLEVSNTNLYNRTEWTIDNLAYSSEVSREVDYVGDDLLVFGQLDFDGSNHALYLYRFDLDGNVVWARRYGDDLNDTRTKYNTNSQMIVDEAGGAIYFVGEEENSNGKDMVICRTDLNGAVPGVDCSAPESFEVTTPSPETYDWDFDPATYSILTFQPSTSPIVVNSTEGTCVPKECDITSKFTQTAEGCFIQLNAAPIVGSQTNVVGYYWVFPDGSTSNDPNPRFFPDPSKPFFSNDICLTVIGSTGGTCCTSKFCEKMISTVCEPNPCTIAAQIVQTSTCEDPCTQTFSAEIIQTNRTIGGYVWTIGGQTFYGKEISYSFPSAGNHLVCLKVVGLDSKGDCCETEICEVFEVNCGSGRLPQRAAAPTGNLPETMDDVAPEKPVPAPNYTLFPNPTTGEVFLQNEGGGSVDLEVLDATGRTVLKQGNAKGAEIRLDLSGEANGMYFVRIMDGTSLQVIRLQLQ